MIRIKAARWVGRAAAALIVLVGAYAAAGLLGGAIPVNRGWRPPARGITIFVESNGVHVGLVVPKRAAGVALDAAFPPSDLADPRYGRHDYLAIGWGEADFYRDTPTWWDLRPATILAAAIGSDRTLLHVEHVARPVPNDRTRAVTLNGEAYRRLARFILTTRVANARAQPGYAGYDVFYPAHGHYDAARTCNAWTGKALRRSGVRIGAWTPFPITVTGWFAAPPRAR